MKKMHTEIFVPPFKSSGVMISTSDSKKVFDVFLSVINPEEVCRSLNGLDNNITGVFRYEYPFIYLNDQKALKIRAWGYLTGIGGLNLTSRDAEKIQNEFSQEAVNKLNKQ